MMATPRPRAFDAQEALAEGLAVQLQRWAVAAGASPEAAHAAAQAGRAVARAVTEGHVCIPLEDLGPALAEAGHGARGESPADATRWRALLRASGVVGDAAAPGAEPLLLDAEGRLALRRLHDAEQRLAGRIAARVIAAGATQSAQPSDAWAAPLPGTAAPFPTEDATGPEGLPGATPKGIADESPNVSPALTPDWQQVAVALAATRRLTVISGGPGTGKTTTVVALLARLLQDNPGLRVALAAPTGKAAARLAQSVRERAASLPEAVREQLPGQASTLHRLLGAGPRGFAYGAGSPLPADLVVVDEASMLDLELACRLFEAVPDSARLVLLGDQDQLAAVEAGAVFAELSGNPGLSPQTSQALAADLGITLAALQTPTARGPGLGLDHAVWLQRAWRFEGTPAIAALAAEVRDGKVTAALARLQAAARGDAAPDEAARGLAWIDDGGSGSGELQAVRDAVLAGFAPFFETLRRDPTDHAAVWTAFEGFRVLCALREGRRGVEGFNGWLSDLARQPVGRPLPSAGVAAGIAGGAAGMGSAWFTGRPVMVTRNEPSLRLANGDVGLALPQPAGGWAVVFREGDGTLRALPAARLPAHETAFALTVHKAQGSEFDRVAVVLGPESGRTAPRELLYTGLTRARTHVTLIASAAAVQRCIASPTRRRSGLAARLREALAAAPTGQTGGYGQAGGGGEQPFA